MSSSGLWEDLFPENTSWYTSSVTFRIETICKSPSALHFDIPSFAHPPPALYLQKTVSVSSIWYPDFCRHVPIHHVHLDSLNLETSKPTSVVIPGSDHIHATSVPNALPNAETFEAIEQPYIPATKKNEPLNADSMAVANSSANEAISRATWNVFTPKPSGI